jgi:hypothetical protein
VIEFCESTANAIDRLRPGDVFSCDEPMTDYLTRTQFISSSNLRKKMARVEGEENRQTKSLRRGQLFHELVLTKKIKPVSEAGFVGLHDRERKALELAQEALMGWSNGKWSSWTSQGICDRSIYWQDEAGRRWRARPDLVIDGLIVDLKTFSNSNMRRFLKNADRNGFLIQAGHYIDACQRAYRKKFIFSFLCLSFSNPITITLDSLSEEDVERANTLLRESKAGILSGC